MPFDEVNLQNERRNLLKHLGFSAATFCLVSTGLISASKAHAATWPPEATSDAAQKMVRWITASGNAAKRPFLIIDKPAARLHVFNENGQWLGSAPVLLGIALGDRTAAGVAGRPLTSIPVKDRTTPAGRFITEPGTNLHGHDIVWIDYDAAISLHRVRSVSASERRLERLGTETETDNRISYGCINVSARFYDRLIAPYFGLYAGVAYVLPDTEPLAHFFKDAEQF
jgi:hypothetical protein